MKVSLNLHDLVVVAFQEKQLVNVTLGPVLMFDVVPLSIDLKDADLLYCGSLLQKVLNFEKPMMKGFLEYQCQLKANPIRWLGSLEKLLSKNGRQLIFNGCVKKMNDLFDLIDKQRQLIEQFQTEKITVEVVGGKEMGMEATERVVPAIDESMSDPDEKLKLPWNGPINTLADFFYQATHTKGDNEEPLLPAKTSSIINFIERHFYRMDGKPFSRSTLQTYLTPSRAEKRPAKGRGIKLKDITEEQDE